MGCCSSTDTKKNAGSEPCAAKKRILIAATSCDQLGNTGKKTGCWLEELAAPFLAFKHAGFDVVVATPKGIRPPMDEGSLAESFMTAECHAFVADAAAQKTMDAAIKISDCASKDFVAVFVPGGHGVCFDLASDTHLGSLLESFDTEKKPIGSVCHGPCAFAACKNSILSGRSGVTGFSNVEEEAVGLSAVVPFSLEDMLNEKTGGKYSKAAEPWASHCVVSGNLVTGQNPGSSVATAAEVLKLLA